MKVMICGSRSINDYEFFVKQLESLKLEISHIVSGGAMGVDKLAEKYAIENDIPRTIIKPQWNKYGKRAGVVRNIEMIDISDCVVAFWDGKSKGTRHSIDYSDGVNKLFRVIYYNCNEGVGLNEITKTN